MSRLSTSSQKPPEIPLSRTSPSYLHSNSTSHAWPFGAIAELIDNAYDPDVNATSIYIDCVPISGDPCLTFTDDGNGLDLQQMQKMLSFGFSEKVEINGKRPIGLFGNGFKSGSMRLGKDAMVFSKKDDHEVIGFLSQTYLEKIKAEDIRIPIVDFKNIISKDNELSLNHIKKYSIFRSDKAIVDQFRQISPKGGTRIVIFNLATENIVEAQEGITRYELNSKKDRFDILIDDNEGASKKMRGQKVADAPRCDFSLRAYCSVLYLIPKIRIVLRGKKVRSVMIAKSLKDTERDVYKPMGGNNKVTITFGFNPKKDPYGVCFYHNNRLIRSYQRLGYQRNADHRGSEVVGIIDCNFLEPTQNKQDFQAGLAYSRCIKAVGDKLNDYWNEKRENAEVAGPSHQFLGTNQEDLPDQTWAQCDKCYKWRKLPDSVAYDKLPDQWFCSMNKNPTQNNCEVAEEPEEANNEIMGPTYNKNYKKNQVEKKLEQKLAKMQQKRKQNEKKNTNGDKVESRCFVKEEDVPEKRPRVEPCEARSENVLEPKPTTEMITAPGEGLKLEAGCSAPNGSATREDKETCAKAVQTDFEITKVLLENAQRKLRKLRSNVIQLLKVVVKEESMQGMIEHLEGDQVDEVLEDSISRI